MEKLMKKTILSTTLLTLLTASSFAAQADTTGSATGFYGKVETGLSISPKETSSLSSGLDSTTLTSKGKSKFNFGAAIGYNLSEDLRVELGLNKLGSIEYSCTQKISGNTNKEAYKINTSALMLRGIYGFDIGMPVKPFVLAGLGAAKHSTHRTLSSSIKKTTFAWEIGTGVDIKVTDALIAEISYRYTSTGAYFKKESIESSLIKFNPKAQFHSIILGLRYSF
jgi:opacity protein-like surface antigen